MNKKVLSVSACLLCCLTLVKGCSDKDESGNPGRTKVSVSIGNWPNSSFESRKEVYNELLEKVRLKNPDVEYSTDEYSYDVTTFMAKAEAGQLPTVFDTWFTEVKKIIDAGYAADLTDEMYERGYAQSLNPDLLSLISDEEGRIYAIPGDAYAQGLAVNKDIFDKYNLEIPQTWEEVAKTARIIKDKTGIPGFAIPAKNNSGGWIFLNIAWSYGTVFLDKLDGKWTAMFDTPECVEALEFIKDLRWKYDVLPDNVMLDSAQLNEMFASGNLGMYISNLSEAAVDGILGTAVENIKMVSIPRGPKGRYSQMGGNVHMISAGASEEQIDAVFDWLEIIGETAKCDDEILQNMEKKLKERSENGRTVLNHDPFPIWVNVERTEKVEEIRKKYTNVDPSDFDEYYEFEGVVINTEPPVAAQELYHILDGCIQKVLTDKDADCSQIISEAALEYQKNYLDEYNI